MDAKPEPKKRFRITGELITRSPLHIDSGNERFVTLSEDQVEVPVAVACVVSDCNAKPYVPGASLRGVIRSWMEQTGVEPSVFKEIFGSGDADNEQGGRIYVHDGFFNPLRSKAPSWPSKPATAVLERHFWDVRRWVQIANGTALSRFTRTAAYHKLFYYEVTPPETVFDICIDAEDISGGALAWILAAMDSFNLPCGGCRLGAGCGIGFGLCYWDAAKVKVTGLTNSKERRAWLNKNCLNAGFSGFPQVRRVFMEALPPVKEAVGPDFILGLEIELRFDGPMLVNDRSRQHEDKSGLMAQPNHAFFTDHTDRILLPARSVRGALRAQAEKIVRTMAEAQTNGARLEPERLMRLACYPDVSQLACGAIYDLSEISKLCLTCRLFGASGWRSPVWVGDFSATEVGEDLFQEFVAIDRFTGGSAEEMKFNALAKYKPVFKGALAIDLARVRAFHFGLIGLLMRDLIEGDIQFGFGRAKGFGACTASIVDIQAPKKYLRKYSELIEPFNDQSPVNLDDWYETVRKKLRPLVLKLEQWVAQSMEKPDESFTL